MEALRGRGEYYVRGVYSVKVSDWVVRGGVVLQVGFFVH